MLKNLTNFKNSLLDPYFFSMKPPKGLEKACGYSNGLRNLNLFFICSVRATNCTGHLDPIFELGGGGETVSEIL